MDENEIYNRASSDVYAEYASYRAEAAKLKKKRDKIDQKLRAIDKHSVTLWELAGMYGMLSEVDLSGEVGDTLCLSRRDDMGDPDEVYSHIDPEHYTKELNFRTEHGF